MWHESVNDGGGKIPITITFCPLCNAAVVFDSSQISRGMDVGNLAMQKPTTDEFFKDLSYCIDCAFGFRALYLNAPIQVE